MRTNQFSVAVTNVRTQRELISAYADANNFFEALCAAFNETTLELQRLDGERKTGGEKHWECEDEKEVRVSLWYTDLKAGEKHVFRMNAEQFSAVSANVYEALAGAFNRVLDELQKQLDLPTFGRKEHYDGFKAINAEPHFVFVNKENLKGPDVAVPDGYLHISERAFKGREDIVNVTLPDGLTHINQYAFDKCANLEGVTLPDSLLAIGSSAFQDCKSLASIAIPDGVDTLMFFTFHGCGALRSVTLPNSELAVHCHAFNFCVGFESIAIPAKAKRIDSDAFTGCSNMRDFFVDPGNEAYSDLDGVLYDKDRTVLIRCPEGKQLEELVIPDSVVEIGDEAFSGCAHLKAIRVPAGLGKISKRAFETWSSAEPVGKEPEYVQAYDGVERITVDGCNDAYADIDGVLFDKEKTVLLRYPAGRTQTAYAIPDGVTKIADRAFEGCAALREVTLPESVTHVGRSAFYKCGELGSIVILTDAFACEYRAFDDTAWYASQPDGLVCIGKTAYRYKGEMPENTRIQIADGTTAIAADAFVNQSNLVGVTMPDSVAYIGQSAFSCCHNLSSVVMPAANVNIGHWAFSQTAYERNKDPEENEQPEQKEWS
jgi:hypothetical protein